MIKLISEDILRFIKFSVVGVLNTIINWIIFIVLNCFGVYYLLANVISYSIATLNSYLFNSKWVFKYNSQEKIKTTSKFIILNIIGLVLNTVILFLFVDIIGLSKIIALIITTMIIMILNYVINKIWVFK